MHLFSFFLFFLSYIISISLSTFFFFFNDTATTEIYTLSLHDALPISPFADPRFSDFTKIHFWKHRQLQTDRLPGARILARDRKSTRLNSSHGYISYAVFCLKKKKKTDSPERAG